MSNFIFTPPGSSSASSGVGGINYISSYDGTSLTGWNTYADAAGTSPVDGTGGTPNITWTSSSSSPLRGSKSFLFTKDAANRQGQGVSYDFTIDVADKGKVLQGSFDYAIGSGTFSDDAVTVWVYDVTNSVLIEPAPYKLKNQSLAAERFGFEFQTASDSTSYRLIFHISGTDSSAYTLKFDNIIVGPQAKLYGSPVNDWAAYTPTVTGLGTLASSSFEWRRVGDSVQIKFVMQGGTHTATPVSITLPNSASMDSAKISASTVVGSYAANASSWNGILFKGASNSVVYFGANGTSYPSGYNGNNFANGTTFGGYFEVPVQGWSSSVLMSTDADTRVVAASYGRGALQAVASSTPTRIIWDTKNFDTHGAMDTSTGIYTVKVPGKYRVSGKFLINNASWTAGTTCTLICYKNGSTYVALYRSDETASTTGKYLGGAGEVIVDCVAGDTLSLVIDHNNGSSVNILNAATHTYISIERISGPSQIAASETIAASYGNAAATTTINTTDTQLTYATKTLDTHGAFNGTTYTMQASGVYKIRHQPIFNVTSFASAEAIEVYIFVNGSKVAGARTPLIGAGGFYGIACEYMASFNAGDAITFYAKKTGSGIGCNIHNDAAYSRISVVKL